MRPEIEAYLRDHGARYTTKALRDQLVKAGYDETEVDAALQETEAARGPQLAETQALSRRYWRLAVSVHVVALFAATLYVLIGPNRGLTLVVILVLGLALLLSLAITGLIGRLLLNRTGLAIALVLPFLAAVLLGGWCIAGMSGPVLG
jgi:hypothetical protein